jgi:hypothetical protein
MTPRPDGQSETGIEATVQPTSTVRRAVQEDLASVLDLAARRRAEYAEQQPRFWRPAEDARTRQSEFFRSLLSESQVAFFVACNSLEVAGFVISRLVPAPPVYDPGGLTCFVDDFVVRDTSDWPIVGPELIEAVRAWAAERGAVQLVAVTGQHDLPKRMALHAAGLSAASEWWVGEMSAGPARGRNADQRLLRAPDEGGSERD